MKLKRCRVALAVMATMVLTACAGVPSDGAGGGGSNRITVIRSTESLSIAPVLVAQGMGYFEDAGFEVEFVTTRGDADAQSALDGGGGQFLVSTSINQLGAIAEGRPFKELSVLSYPINTYAITADKAKELGFDKSMTLRERAQLFKGLTVGVGTVGGASDLIFRAIMRQNGVNPEEDVEITALGTNGVFPALKSGHIDATLLVYPDIAQAEKDAVAVSALPVYGDLVPWVAKSANMSLATTTKYAEENPENVAAFMDAIDKALKLIKSDPVKARDVTKKYFEATDENVYATAWETIPDSYPPAAGYSEEQFDAVVEMSAKIGTGDLSGVSYGKAIYQAK